MTTHSYKDSIIDSELNPVPDMIYHKLFSDITTITTIPRDDIRQTKGRMDKIISFSCGKTLRIEEKTRKINHGDFLFEEWSAVEYGREGWATKPTEADYLLYYVQPTGEAYIYNMEQLKDVWRKRGAFFKTIGTKVKAYNEGWNGIYTSINWAVKFSLLKIPCVQVTL